MKLNQLERFAEAALTGLLASINLTGTEWNDDTFGPLLAQRSYEIAECMMVQAHKREKPFDQQSENDE